jgi:hypothetical protein
MFFTAASASDFVTSVTTCPSKITSLPLIRYRKLSNTPDSIASLWFTCSLSQDSSLESMRGALAAVAFRVPTVLFAKMNRAVITSAFAAYERAFMEVLPSVTILVTHFFQLRSMRSPF